jgi:hypothetical protein
MSGDGKTQYDHDHDNESHELAGCSVSSSRAVYQIMADMVGTIQTQRHPNQRSSHLCQIQVQTFGRTTNEKEG